MKYCYKCNRVTAGEPVFCQFCGRTYDLKLCPRLHPNPRAAEFCSQCGSRDLSVPQPKINLFLKPFLFLLSMLPGVLLLGALATVLVFFLYQLLTDPNNLAGLMCIAFGLGLLLLLWMLLPKFVRKLIARAFRKEKRGRP